MAQSREAVLAALSDVVTVDPNQSQSQSQSESQSSQRSNPNQFNVNMIQDEQAPPTPDKTNPFQNANSNQGMGARLAGAFRKATGQQDKESKRREKQARMKEEIDKSTAKTSRMDVIDRLDLTGIHGSSMFHHDSPYDAVSPHRNRHAQKAPVKAFDPNVDPMTGKKKAGGKPSSPLSKGLDSSRPSISSRTTSSGPSYSSPNLPILNSDGTTSAIGHDYHGHGNGNDNPSSSHIPIDGTGPSRGGNETDSMTSASVPPSEAGDDDRGYYKTPSNQAEIWGVTTEPWQDFASPKASSSKDKNKRSSKAGKNSSYNSNNLMPNGRNGSYDQNQSRSGLSSSASSVMDMEAILTGKSSEQRKKEKQEEEEMMRRRADLDGENLVGSGVSPFPERDWSAFKDQDDGTGGVKRNKSLIKRIKSARQSPNVPPPDSVDDVELSSISNNNYNDRRYGSGRSGKQHKYSPSTPPISTNQEGNPNLYVNNPSERPGSGNSNTGGYGFQGYSSTDSNLSRKKGMGGSMRIKTRGLSPGNSNYQQGYSSSPGDVDRDANANLNTPTNSNPSQDYLNVVGEDERRGRSNSNNSSNGNGNGGNGNGNGNGNGASVGRSGSLFGRFGRKGKVNQK